MIPFRLLPLLRPHMRPAFCSLRSGSLTESRTLGFRDRLAPESLARLLSLQPLRLCLAIGLIVLLALASTAISIVKIAPAAVENAVAGTSTPTADRVDVLDMTRWEF